MICKNCGANTSDNAKFCKVCGAPVNTDSSSAQPPQKPKSPNTTLVVLICVLGSLLIIGAIVVLIVFLNQGGDADNTAPSAAVQSTTSAQPSANVVNAVTEPTTEDTSVLVPDVVGISSDSARKYITDAGFKCELVLQASDSVQADKVISQSPGAGKTAEKGSKVTIYVAKPKETSQQSSQQSQSDVKTLYVIASEDVTLRDAPTRTGRELAKISRGEAVNYISADGEFYRVSYKGTEGYILSEFLSSDKSKYNSGSGNASLQNGDYLYCRASDFSTLRSGMSRSASSLGKITTGERVSYLGQSGEWFHVKYGDKTGYVLKAYFSPQADAPLNYGDD